MSRINRYSEAFKESANLIGLSGIVAVSCAATSVLPLLVGVAAETAYLLFVPDSKWYGSRLSQRGREAALLKRKAFRDQTVPQLREHMRERYLHLETVSVQIRAQAASDPKWYGDILPKLDYLLDKFLTFAVKEAQFRAYLKTIWEECHSTGSRPGGTAGFELVTTDNRQGSRTYDSNFRGGKPAGGNRPQPKTSETVAQWVGQVVNEVQEHYNGEIAGLKELEDREADTSTRAVIGKRIDVLQQRHEFVNKIGRILTNLNYQMELLEDTFGLINDQIRARSPEQVLSEIEGVVDQTDSMTQLLEELAPFEHMAA